MPQEEQQIHTPQKVSERDSRHLHWLWFGFVRRGKSVSSLAKESAKAQRAPQRKEGRCLLSNIKQGTGRDIPNAIEGLGRLMQR